MHASKYIKLPVLLDASEMEALFEALGSFLIYEVGKVSADIEVSKEAFLQSYSAYCEKLKRGEEAVFQASHVLTVDTKCLEIREVRERFLARPILPIVQLQPAAVRYSKADASFQTQVYGKESISWGIQFSYPFLFQDPQIHAIEKVTVCERFPNTALFQNLQRWIRHNTKATPFVVEGKVTNVPVRLGKTCFEWINHHPNLGEVAVAS